MKTAKLIFMSEGCVRGVWAIDGSFNSRSTLRQHTSRVCRDVAPLRLFVFAGRSIVCPLSRGEFFQPKPYFEMNIQTNSTLTCPDCGYQKDEQMPEDSCQFFYECESCGKVLKPEKGDCCVFCSYGSVACPPVQQPGGC